MDVLVLMKPELNQPLWLFLCRRQTVADTQRCGPAAAPRPCHEHPPRTHSLECVWFSCGFLKI
jgi:hypothetical protein